MALAFAAAVLAPHLPPLVRGGRIAVDVVFALGFVGYLGGGRVRVATRRGTVSKAVAIAIVLGGGVYAALVPGVDGWRRLFRAALAVALSATIALGIGRSLPAMWLHRARALSLAFVVVETVVAVVAAVEIDAPIAFAAVRPACRAIALRLEGGGYAVPLPLGRLATLTAPQAIELRDARIVATTRLADTLHLLGDDPVPPLQRILDDATARTEWLHGRVDQCTMLRVVRPPRAGYRDPQYGAAVAAAVRHCRRAGGARR